MFRFLRLDTPQKVTKSKQYNRLVQVISNKTEISRD